MADELQYMEVYNSLLKVSHLSGDYINTLILIF